MAPCSNSMLLAGVYVELLGEKQATLVFAGNGAQAMGRAAAAGRAAQRPAPLPPLLTAEEETAHRAFVKSLGAEPVWLQYLGETVGSDGLQVNSAG